MAVANDLALPIAAPQQSRGPRPLPLFLSLVAEAAREDPAVAAAALKGLARYQQTPRAPQGTRRPVVEQLGSASLRDCGGEGPVVVLVPSLINPPDILDLDPDCSLAEALAFRHRILLLDWGSAKDRRQLDLLGHVEQLLVPLLERIGAVVLVGHCLGGTLGLAAAVRSHAVRAVATLASPFAFAAYPQAARSAFAQLWKASKPASTRLGFLPMEVLQAAFWQIDPQALVAKFARFAEFEEDGPKERRFTILEDWANGGEPLPAPAAEALVEHLFEAGGTLAPLPGCPMLHVTAKGDRIVPSEAAPPGNRLSCPAGHVGMIVGSRAPHVLHAPLLSWLEGLDRPR